ncbi:hypothetical protein FHG87_014401, partial [Trinorchestia longiramus]
MSLKACLFSLSDRAIPRVHQSSTRVREARVPLASWEPQFCVLLQDQSTFTSYRAEEMAIIPGYRIRPRAVNK